MREKCERGVASFSGLKTLAWKRQHYAGSHSLEKNLYMCYIQTVKDTGKCNNAGQTVSHILFYS